MNFFRKLIAAAALLFAAVMPAVASTDCSGTVSQVTFVPGATTPYVNVKLSVGEGFTILSTHSAYKDIINWAQLALTTQGTVIVTFLGSTSCSTSEFRTDMYAVYANPS